MDLFRRRHAPTPPTVEPERLEAVAEGVAALAAARIATDPVSRDAARRARQLHDHVTGHVLPRVRSLDAPIVVLLLGPTGAGKSTLMNTLAGAPISPTGVLRPTTRRLVALVGPDDLDDVLADGAPLAGIDPALRTIVEQPTARRGVVIVDAPDIDSIEHANRELADRLAEAADLALFVTTATRYADRVPWDVLGRVRDRGLPLIVVVNRMPDGEADREAIVADVRRLLVDAGLGGGLDADDGAGIEIVAIREGAIADGGELLEREAVAPIAARIDRLAANRDERRALAARALAGSLAGLAPLLDRIADDLAHEAIDLQSLRRTAEVAFSSELTGLRDELARGTFLREAALRQWQAFVGADEVTRAFSSGIGRVRAAVGSLIGGRARAPIAEVREDTVRDIVALARSHADAAVRRAATAWSNGPDPGPRLAADASTWSLESDFDARLAAALEGWIESIGADVQATGAPKRALARGASLGVNGIGVAVMLATFAHTGGLTGTEVGVAAATAFLNQKLLSALFGEAAMVELIARARQRLVDAVSGAFRDELDRFDERVGVPEDREELERRLRDTSRRLRLLPPSIPHDARGLPIEPGAPIEPAVELSVRSRDETRA